MGQYFYPTFYKQKGKRLFGKQFFSWDFGDGLKLTEHAYVGTQFLNAVLTQLFNNPQIVYWCGDYIEKKDFSDPKMYARIKRTFKKYHTKINSDGSHESSYPKPEIVPDFSIDKFIVNHTKKVFINMKKYVEIAPTNKWSDTPLHPLCLLTALGNTRGGGDYYGPNQEDCGCWAGDVIEIKANEYVIPEGYKDVTEDCACYIDE